MLEPIRFRYSTEKIVDEQPEKAPQEPAASAESKPPRPRRRKSNPEPNPEGAAKQADSVPKQEKLKKAQKNPETEGDQPLKNRRRSNNRRRKPQKPTPEA